MCLFPFVDVGNTLTIFASTQSACAQTCFRCTKNNFIFTCANKLEYVNYPFFSWKRGVYELIGYMNY